ncbi:MAG: pirin family protein [Polyangiaceae bacterium]
MTEPIVSDPHPLGFPWVAADPFLFCVHHLDHYPKGNAALGPEASLAGRRLGMDFEVRDGWRMYHGHQVPGFPQHPHRGFETITVARQGFIDHSDSLGAAARFGRGDVQWMTAGRGVVHSEMFPLLKRDADNPVELFQIWINLPARDKLVEPYFTMFWRDQVPVVEREGATVTVVAGRFGDAEPPAPPPNSWASRAEAEVALWTIVLRPGASLLLPVASEEVNRTLYFFRGSRLAIEAPGGEGPGRRLDEHAAVLVRPDIPVKLEAGDDEVEILVLQGRPIGEPVAQHGPFVMNTRAELQQAVVDYQRTQFGGWPWGDDAPVHERDAGRFARHANGRVERADEPR